MTVITVGRHRNINVAYRIGRCVGTRMAPSIWYPGKSKKSILVRLAITTLESGEEFTLFGHGEGDVGNQKYLQFHEGWVVLVGI